MKKTLSILFGLIISITYGQTQYIKGQNVNSERSINYSSNTEITKSGEIINLSCGKKQSHLSFKTDYTLSHFDKDLNLIKEEDITKEIKGEIIDFKVINDTINIITSESKGWSVESLGVKKVNRYYSPVNNFEIKEKTLFENKDGFGSAESAFSENNDYFSLIVGVKDKDNVKKQVILFNNMFEVLFASDITKSLSLKPFEISSVNTLNDKTVIVIIKVFENSKKLVYSYKLLKVKEDINETLEIETQNNFASDLRLFNDNSFAFLVGHFSNRSKPKELQGFYISKLNLKDLKQEFTKATPFSKDYIDRMNILSNKKSFNQLNYLEIFDFYVTDNSYFIINETEYNHTISENMTNSNFAVNTIYYGNMAINKFNLEGDLIAFDIIYKTIPTNNFYPIQSPSASINKNNQIYIFLVSSKEQEDGQDIYRFGENTIYNNEFKYDYDLNKETVEHRNIPYSSINYFNHDNQYLILFNNEREKRGLIKIFPN